MPCPTECYLGHNLTFSVTSHNTASGAIQDLDAAAVPAFRVYEDETAVAIATGNMAKVDAAQTGLYTETLACTTANGYEIGKSYTIYVTGTCNATAGGISFGFKVNPITSAIMANLSASASTIIRGTVSHDNTAATTTVFYSDDITEATADHYNGRIIIFTSGDLTGQATDITDYALAAGEGQFTVTALTEAPADNVTFVIV